MTIEQLREAIYRALIRSDQCVLMTDVFNHRVKLENYLLDKMFSNP